MKLQTMLLPTGEFVLVLSEAPDNSAQWGQEFREKTGAVAMLVTTEPVEIVDALVDDEAIRAGDRGEWQELGLLDKSDQASFSYASLDDVSWKTPEPVTVTFDRPGDENLLRMLYGEADFSPAGLVKSPGSAQEKIELGHYDLVGHRPRPHHVEVDSDGIAQIISQDPVNPSVSGGYSAPRTVGRFPDTGPIEHQIGLNDIVVGTTWHDQLSIDDVNPNVVLSDG